MRFAQRDLGGFQRLLLLFHRRQTRPQVVDEVQGRNHINNPNSDKNVLENFVQRAMGEERGFLRED